VAEGGVGGVGGVLWSVFVPVDTSARRVTRRIWSAEENAALIADYFSMLKSELRNEKLNKAAHLRALKPRLNGRTDRAIEDKHQNVSAILHALKCPSIDGYKPLRNFQLSLFDAVEERYLADSELAALLTQSATNARPPLPADGLSRKVPAPRSPRPPNRRVAARMDRVVANTDWFEIDARNRELGRLGELFVLEYERDRLTQSGFPHLADQVEHVSVTKGDGLGFDIRSFGNKGEDSFIEVKTTSYSRDTPFYLSRHELNVSQGHAKTFRLCRVFHFFRNPLFFEVPGPLDQSCLLEPMMYSGTAR
jgi:hypothetical protein